MLQKSLTKFLMENGVAMGLPLALTLAYEFLVCFEKNCYQIVYQTFSLISTGAVLMISLFYYLTRKFRTFPKFSKLSTPLYVT